MQPLEIVLVSADPLARAGLQMMLADEPDCRVIGAIDGDSWHDALAIYQPDVMLYDLGWQSDATLPDLREAAVPVIALVADDEGARAGWLAGAAGVVVRNGTAEQLLATIQAVYNGLIVFSADYLPAAPITTDYSAQDDIEPLTPREQEVLTLLARGLTNRAIAYQLTISDHTVKFHVNALLTKLGAQSRTEAAVKATRLGLLSV